MKVIIGVVIAIAVIGGGYSLIAGSSVPTPATQQASETSQDGSAAKDESTGFQTVALKVGNMYCASCPVIVKRTLEGVDGVRNVEVSFRNKTALVSYDPNKCSPAKLVAATEGVGFPSTVKKTVK